MARMSTRHAPTRDVDPVSYWLEEALARDPGAACPPLTGSTTSDVCIAGGGYTGLWTAYELTERQRGLDIVLLEADICGSGASSANGGFLCSSWHDAAALCRLYGEERGLHYAALLADEVGEVGAWCERHQADIAFRHAGMVYAQAAEWQPGPDRDTLDLLAAHGLGDRLQAIDAARARAVADSPRFLGGMYTPDAATVQPARLARELRRVLLERGVRIHERTPLVTAKGGRPVTVRTPQGCVNAGRLVVATGAWAAGHPPFRRAFAATVDYVVATEPVPELLEQIGWTSDTAILDRRRAIYYLRRTDDGRIVIGGGSLGVAFGDHIAGRAGRSRRKAAVPAAGLSWLFPQLRDVGIDRAWSGPIDAAATHLPFFETSPCGTIHAGLGFSGHGLAATKLGGKTLASLVLGADDEWAHVPVVGPPVSRVPPEPWRWPLVKCLSWEVIKGEMAQERGKTPGLDSRLATRIYTAYRSACLRPRSPRPAKPTEKP